MKIRKIFIAGLLTLALLVPMAMPVAATPNDIIQDLFRQLDEERAENARLRQQIQDMENDSRVREPLVHIVTPQNITVEPGEVIDVPVTIRNIGSGTAQNFLSTAAVSGAAPVVVEFLNNSNRLNSLGQNSQRDMIMRVSVAANADPADTATITITHRYNNQAGAPQSSTDTITVRVAGEAGATGITIGNFQMSTDTIGPDQTFNVTADLQNLGTITANNVQVGVGNLDAEAIFLTSDLNQNNIATLEPGQTRQVSFTFRTARDIESITHEITFSPTYTGSATPNIGRLFVTVLADYATTSPNIEIRSLSVPSGRLNVGQSGRITFELVNTGDAIAHDIRIEAGAEGSALVPSTSNVQTLRSLGVGESHSFEFGFMPTSNAGHHSHPVRIEVGYTIRGAGGTPSPFVQYVALNVNNPEQEDDTDTGRTQIPRVIVSSYAAYPQIPRAGQNFDLEITFMNTSNTRSVNNVVIVKEAQTATVAGQTGSGDAVFTPVGGSNTLFIPALGPGESVTKNITMFTVPDAAPRMYTLRVNLEYQDQDFYSHEFTQQLSIPVAQLSRLETEPPELMIMPFMDSFGFIDFDFRIMNTGRVDLRNIRVRVEGDFDTRESNRYLGNLAVGRTITFNGRVRPSETGFGLQEGAIVIYGEDDAGEIVYISHPLSIEVMGGGDFGMDGGMDGFGGDYWPGDDGWMEGGADRFPPGRFPEEGGFMGEYFNGGVEGSVFSRMFGFIRRPIFWGPAAGVVAAVGIGVAVIFNRKRSQLDFDDN